MRINFKKSLEPVNLLRVLYIGVLIFLLIEVEPLFIYVSFGLLIGGPVIQKLPRFLSNLMLILLTGYLAVYFQFELHPESAISFFMILTAFKFAQIEARRDFDFLVHCLFVVIGGGALFNVDLYYISFSFSALLFLFFMFQLKDYKSSESFNKQNFLNILKIFVFSSPLILSLFIFFPRYRYFFPSLGSEKNGKIGYSQTLDNNKISSLRLNGIPALRVFSKTELPQNKLYWRGRVFSKTDGYNWKVTRQKSSEQSLSASNIEFVARYQPLQNFYGDLIALDKPVSLESEGFQARYYPQTQTFETYFRNNKKAYVARSSNVSEKVENLDEYLQVPSASKFIVGSLPKNSSDNVEAVISNLKSWMQEENFLYSLSPGKMNSMQDFINNKRGYCTHYAALLAIYLRLNNIPSRIVSGFQGGEYNRLGEYYLIRSNDAHTWVEAYTKGQWLRVDPTGWVAPERVLIGGQKFLAPYPFAKALKEWFGVDLSRSNFLSSYYSLQKYIDYLNSQVNQFFNNFNLEAQRLLAESLNLNLKLFFSLALILPILIVFIFFIFFNLKFNKVSETEKFHKAFNRRLRKSGISWEQNEGVQKLLTKVNNHPNRSIIYEVLSIYLRFHYGPRPKNEDKLKLKTLLRQI